MSTEEKIIELEKDFQLFQRTGISDVLLKIMNNLNNDFHLFINITHDFYRNGVNCCVAVMGYDKNKDEFIDNNLSTGMWGDNGEFKTDTEALIFGISMCIGLLKKNNK